MNAAERRFRPTLERINSLEESCVKLADAELQAKTAEFRKRLSSGETLDELLPEAFAVVREAARRTIGLRHRDEQILGGIALHAGLVAQMETGEGKTLTATAPAYLNSLTGEGVHVVTPTDYLAYRDGKTMSPVYAALGMLSGSFQEGMNEREAREAWRWGVTYVDARNLGFQNLRDDLGGRRAMRRIPSLSYAIVDELDAVLIDEAKTPFIIAGEIGRSGEEIARADRFARELRVDVVDGRNSRFPTPDAIVDPQRRTVTLTEAGAVKSCRLLPAERSDPIAQGFMACVRSALAARYLYLRGADYEVFDGELCALSEGSRAGALLVDGALKAALETKESIPIDSENQTLASITIRGLFAGYRKLCGMTATASTEAEELRGVYGLEIVEIPPHRPCARVDLPDRVFRTTAEKQRAIIAETRECWEKRRPVLLATRFTAEAASLAADLKSEGIPAEALLGRGFDIRDADLIGRAGRPGAVTIVPEGAGIGIHIDLGGPGATEAEVSSVRAAGGIHLIGCERSLTRRMDDQLRGRVARLGEPGSARFYVSLEDDLCKLAGGLERALGAEFSQRAVLDSEAITKTIADAQARIRRQQFDIRAQLVDFESSVRDHIETFRSLRDVIPDAALRGKLIEMAGADIRDRFEVYLSTKTEPSRWNLKALSAAVARIYQLTFKPLADEPSRLDRIALQRELLERSADVVIDQWSRLEQAQALDAAREVLLAEVNRARKSYMHEIDREKKRVFLSKETKEPRDAFEEAAFHAFAAALRNAYESLLESFIHFPAPRRTHS